LPPAYLLVLAEIISLTLKMEAICSSETSVATQQTTRRHIPEDDTLVKKYSSPHYSYLLFASKNRSAKTKKKRQRKEKATLLVS
jgi:hypothetical protein